MTLVLMLIVKHARVGCDEKGDPLEGIYAWLPDWAMSMTMEKPFCTRMAWL